MGEGRGGEGDACLAVVGGGLVLGDGMGSGGGMGCAFAVGGKA